MTPEVRIEQLAGDLAVARVVIKQQQRAIRAMEQTVKRAADERDQANAYRVQAQRNLATAERRAAEALKDHVAKVSRMLVQTRTVEGANGALRAMVDALQAEIAELRP